MHKIKYQRIPVVIASAGISAGFSANTDKLYKNITGIAVSLPFDGSLYGTTLALKIASEEIFDEQFEVKLIAVNSEVAADSKFYPGTIKNPFNEPAEGSLVDGKFTDGGATTGVTFPYTALIYLRLEND